MNAAGVLVDVIDLKMHFRINDGFFKKKSACLKAVDGVSFDIKKGETLGLVGESGCGKTTVGRCISRLYSITSGSIIFRGTDISRLDERDLALHRRYMHMIFQDPYASLNPRMTVSDIIQEPLLAHGVGTKKERSDRVIELLEMVGLNSEQASRFPHEFSGGQRQRIGIARSLAGEPEFIIADEPISALDVSIQAQVVNLLEELQERLGLTYLFIAHDLSMVKHISDRVGVMYLGRIVELTDSSELYRNPLHPYTKALMSAIPIPDPDLELNRKRVILSGDVPSPIDPPSGCSFRTRCALAQNQCAVEPPVLKEVASGHFVSCHLV
ncbi:MAG TPA: peptide ABC transporter ATP-binding protein [Firmicutes bacterium]|nr:peptide ABC transporter ATP-binding protein [Bacillota bacterium]